MMIQRVQDSLPESLLTTWHHCCFEGGAMTTSGRDPLIKEEEP